ncbi:MAG: hypothetical protein ACR2GY_12350 [Phycisphaerales bacterium]
MTLTEYATAVDQLLLQKWTQSVKPSDDIRKTIDEMTARRDEQRLVELFKPDLQWEADLFQMTVRFKSRLEMQCLPDQQSAFAEKVDRILYGAAHDAGNAEDFEAYKAEREAMMSDEGVMQRARASARQLLEETGVNHSSDL